MKKPASILFTCFYLLGTLVLPFADFSIIKDLPGMFKQCKATEDADLNVFEFLTEHVSGLGQLIENSEHEEDEEEAGDKPHAPVQFQFEQHQLICFNQQLKTPPAKKVLLIKAKPVLTNRVYIADYTPAIFRPPIV